MSPSTYPTLDLMAVRCRDCAHESRITVAGATDANRVRCNANQPPPNAGTFWRHDWRGCPAYEERK